MSENMGFLMRIKYVKRGRLAFLSHLETIRSMERIIRRAGLPYAVTEGFNPHMKVSFGPALPVGAASECEYLDLRLREYVKPQDALQRMLGGSVGDLAPVECGYIDLRADAVTVAFPVSEWTALFEDCSAQDVQEAFGALMERGYIEVKRKPKKRRGPLEVKQVPLEGRLLGEPLVVQEGSGVRVDFATRAQDQGSLRPDRFIEAALSFVEGEPPRLASLVRLRLRGDE